MRKKAIELTQTWNKDLTPGDTLEGVYLKTEIYQGNYGETEKYIIEAPNGESISSVRYSYVASVFSHLAFLLNQFEHHKNTDSRFEQNLRKILAKDS